jgi:tetratricopeptide (TPR) repeat protein
VLEAALERAPGNAQGWLNLAALERLSANYAKASAACDKVNRAGQPWYATGCRLETASLQGRHTDAGRGLQGLLIHVTAPEQASWLWSLQAENRERAGQDVAAAEAYARSLALEPDLYTAIAYADLLLRRGKLAQALRLLEPLPETDAVLLRRAAAWRRLGDHRWTGLRATLRERAAELLRRGDDPSLHGREAALVALWLDDDPVHALALSRANLLLQREPLDWWVALYSARLARDTGAEVQISSAIRSAGLVDVRLASGVAK